LDIREAAQKAARDLRQEAWERQGISLGIIEDSFLRGVEWLADYLLKEKVLPVGYGVRVLDELESPERPTS
jgi:hypothetical protein